MVGTHVRAEPIEQRVGWAVPHDPRDVGDHDRVVQAQQHRPVVALAGTLVPAFAYDLLNFPGGLCTIAVGVALYSVADAGHSRAGISAIVAVVGGFLGIGVLLGRGHVFDLITALWFAGWLVASLILGETDAADGLL
jgi:hypothetical protein